MEKRNFLLQFLQFCILCLCACSCFLAESLKVKADLILDNRQIDGSHTIYFGGQPLREIQYGGTVVWRAGAYITYVIDNKRSQVKQFNICFVNKIFDRIPNSPINTRGLKLDKIEYQEMMSNPKIICSKEVSDLYDELNKKYHYMINMKDEYIDNLR